MASSTVTEIERYLAQFSAASLCSSDEVVDALLDIRAMVQATENPTGLVKGELISV